MNASDIQRAILIDRWRRSFVMPNWCPPKWWECDVFELTQAGMFVEYEIKLSKSDFKADAAKSNRRYEGTWPDWQEIIEFKHTLLEQRDPRGPSRFFFVTPINLLKPADLPSWAGLIEAHHDGYRARTRLITPAPKLHKVKAPDHRARAEATCYYRYLNLLTRKLIPTNPPTPPENA